MGALLKHPITSGVIASLIVAAIAGTFSFYVPSFAPFAMKISEAGRFLAADVTLPRWTFWSWIVMTLLCFCVAAGRSSAQRGLAAFPVEQSYQSDVMFGLRWRWNVTPSGFGNMKAFCRNCDNQLGINDFQPHMQGGAYYRCDACGDDGKIDTALLPQTALKATREAERRFRTGEWRGSDERITSAKRRI